MNIRKILIGGLSSITAMLLIGCGSDSSIPATNTESYNVGYFIDSPVEGIEYFTESGISGKTDSLGKFNYKYENEKITFKIGKLELGNTESSKIITPENLSDKDLLLQFLQSCDEDNNLSNGITISESITESLSNLNEEISFENNINTENDLLSIDNDLANKIDSDYDGHIDISIEDANKHFNESISKLKYGNNDVEKIFKESNNGQNQGYGNIENSNYIGDNDNSTVSDDFIENGDNDNFTISDFDNSEELTILTEKEIESLIKMWNEEKMAKDLYFVLGDQFNAIVLKNISKRSESKHEEKMKDLIIKYKDQIFSKTNFTEENFNLELGLFSSEEIYNLYTTLLSQGVSEKDSYLVGCLVEYTDINDLNEAIEAANTNGSYDLVSTFESLRDGSYNHFWAFDNALKNINVKNGCSELGDYINEASKLYPNKENI